MDDKEEVEQMMKLTKTILARIWWLGRGTATMMGVAVLLALTVGLSSTALAGTGIGSRFDLGKVNTVNAVSKLVGSLAGSSLTIDNNSTASGATALRLEVEPGKPPMSVNSTTEVQGLNVDSLDGKSANELIRVASFAGPSPLADGTDGALATTNITVPAPGFLVIDAGSDMFQPTVTDTIVCSIEVDNSLAPGSSRLIELNGNEEINEEENCSTNTVVPVSGGTHTVDLEADGAESTARYGDAALSAIYVPFGATGAPPTSAAISATGEAAEPETREVGQDREG